MDSLIAKYFFDELNQEEERQLLDWIADKPENAEEFVHSKKLLNLAESENQVFNPDAEEAWLNVQERLMSEKSTLKIVKRKNRSRVVPLMRIAAAFLILFGVSYAISRLNVFETNAHRGATVASQVEDADDIIEVITGNEVKVIYLPDSSIVFLNRDSKIIYSQHFVGDKRNIYLEGESFFDVKPDAEHPFCVYTANTKTRVLGTSFNIRAYSSDEETEMNVAHGKVVFFLEGTQRDRMMVLESKDKVVFNKNRVTLEKFHDAGNGYMAWMNDFETEIDVVEEIEINEGLFLSPYSKEVIYAREFLDPIRYINNVSNWSNTFEWKNHLVKKTMIDGEIYSTAVVASFDNVSLKATFYNSEDQIIGAEIFVVKETVKPGSIIEYKRKLDQYFDETANVIVEIYHAQVVDAGY